MIVEALLWLATIINIIVTIINVGVMRDARRRTRELEAR
jgi:hypothetical protein